jgi:hypothetical protein
MDGWMDGSNVPIELLLIGRQLPRKAGWVSLAARAVLLGVAWWLVGP